MGLQCHRRQTMIRADHPRWMTSPGQTPPTKRDVLAAGPSPWRPWLGPSLAGLSPEEMTALAAVQRRPASPAALHRTVAPGTGGRSLTRPWSGDLVQVGGVSDPRPAVGRSLLGALPTSMARDGPLWRGFGLRLGRPAPRWRVARGRPGRVPLASCFVPTMHRATPGTRTLPSFSNALTFAMACTRIRARGSR